MSNEPALMMRRGTALRLKKGDIVKTLDGNTLVVSADVELFGRTVMIPCNDGLTHAHPEFLNHGRKEGISKCFMELSRIVMWRMARA